MPRRNKREGFEPLDLTPAAPPKAPKPTPIRSSREAIENRWRREEERRQAQIDARANDGIDWSSCLVLGCINSPVQAGYTTHASRPDRRDHRMELPLCFEHVAVAYHQAAKINDPLMVDAVALVLERRAEREDNEAKAQQKARLAKKEGDIYYVRLNGLIKVGWTRELRERLRAYGPNVEVLCHYPATFDDETNLHRQLAPFRAKGREWYQDCAALHDFVTRAIAQHGEPHQEAWWSEPKDTIASRKSKRR